MSSPCGPKPVPIGNVEELERFLDDWLADVPEPRRSRLKDMLLDLHAHPVDTSALVEAFDRGDAIAAANEAARIYGTVAQRAARHSPEAATGRASRAGASLGGATRSAVHKERDADWRRIVDRRWPNERRDRQAEFLYEYLIKAGKTDLPSIARIKRIISKKR